MKNFRLYTIAITVLLVGCQAKKYKFTSKVCDTNLCAEIFEVNAAGVNAEYLTDSSNFRLYIGSIDSEHERYIYTCRADSLYVDRLLRYDTTGGWRVASVRGYNLLDLKQKRIFETRYDISPGDSH